MMDFSVMFLAAMKLARFVLVRIPLSPTVTLVSSSRKFEIFYSVVTIFDLTPESVINVSLSFLFVPVFPACCAGTIVLGFT